MTRKRVLHREVEPTTRLPLLLGEGWGEVGKSTDQRKPSGCTITRIIFPSKEKLCNNIAGVIARIKKQRMAINLGSSFPV